MLLKFLDGFPSSARLTSGQIDAYLEALAEFRYDALTHALRRFREEDVEDYNASYVPTVPQLIKQVKLFDTVLRRIDADRAARPKLVVYPIGGEPPPRAVPLGPIKVDFGNGPIDLSKNTPEEIDEVFRLRGPLPPKEPELALVKPNLKRMS